MNIPKELLYTSSHEWIEKLDNGNIRVGITDFAQEELGDIVFLELPQEGDPVLEGEAFADIESVKAASEIYSPVNGTVAAVNEEAVDDPAIINEDPYGAWLIEIADPSDNTSLMDADDYEKALEED